MIYLAKTGEHFLMAATPQTDDPAFRQTQSLMGNLVDMREKWDGEGRKKGKNRPEKERADLWGELETYAVVWLPVFPSLRYPDNHTQQRREIGQKWCEADCEGDDTWPVTGTLWNKDGDQQKLNKHTRPNDSNVLFGLFMSLLFLKCNFL